MLVLAMTTIAAEANKKPDLAFLEYLASLEKVDGKLVGPMDMLEADEFNKPLAKPAGEKTSERKPLDDPKVKLENPSVKEDKDNE